MLKHTFTVVEAQTSLTQPFTGPQWPDNTFNRGGEFFWGGEQVAAVYPDNNASCIVAFIAPGFRLRVFNFAGYPTVDRLAAAYNILRLHPGAAIPSEITGVA